MSDLDSALEAHAEEQAVRTSHRESGLRDDVLLDRYVQKRDLVAFLDETYRSTPDGKFGYYGLSAVVFHADDLPDVRRGLEFIAGRNFWHSKDAFKDKQLRERIGDMNEYISQHAAMPVAVFDVRREEITEANDREIRDLCLERALRVLDEDGIRDVVLDQFHPDQQQNVGMDHAVLAELKAKGEVDEQMWMHHAKMGEEHALWSADTVAWSVQRHYFGVKVEDSRHVAPLRGQLREVHALTGTSRRLDTAPRAQHLGPAGRQQRLVPIKRLADQIDQLRQRHQRPPAAPPQREETMRGPLAGPSKEGPSRGASAPSSPDMPKAPPAYRPEGPSRSL